MRTDFAEEIADINLRRIGWIILLSTAMNLAILACNLAWLRNGTLAAWQVADVVISVGMLAVVHRLLTRPARLAWKHGVVAAFLILVLAFMDAYYFVLSPSYGHNSAYLLGVVTLGVLLLIPPRIFFAALLANHAVYCLLVARSSDAPAFEILEGTTAGFVAALAAWLLHRAKVHDLRQQSLIAARNRELQRGNEEMAEVMAITAHDLRSPLQGVKHLLDFAVPSAEVGAPGALSAALRIASKSCGEMIALINRLLDAHAPEATLAAGDLRPHLAQATARAELLAAAKDIRFDLQLPGEPAMASVSADVLAQALDNLLGNAIKFSPANSTVTLRLLAREPGWCVEIRDEGPGMPGVDPRTIFEKFHRGQHSGSGSGLGLFIVRKCMDTLHGSVRCEPRENGTTFWLEFARVNGRKLD